MKRLTPICLTALLVTLFILKTIPVPAAEQPPRSNEPTMKVVQIVEDDRLQRFYPGALHSLLEEVKAGTNLDLNTYPVIIKDFNDPVLFETPFAYVNYGDRKDWDLPAVEVENLRNYLKRGGFLFIDAGVSSEFLKKNNQRGQRHSFPAWEVTPEIEALFKRIFPKNDFQQLARSHRLFRAFYSGLPSPEHLPESIRDFVINEKWPQGTYSLMGLEIDGRPAVIASPIAALGWGKNELGQWSNSIAFRIRESAPGLSEKLSNATYSGVRYTVTREDGRKDIIYCQPDTVPAWVQEPDGRWRLFRYYNAPEINDFAHRFYTRLGVNLFVYVLTQ